MTKQLTKKSNKLLECIIIANEIFAVKLPSLKNPKSASFRGVWKEYTFFKDKVRIDGLGGANHGYSSLPVDIPFEYFHVIPQIINHWAELRGDFVEES